MAKPKQSFKQLTWTLKFDGDVKVPDLKATLRTGNPQDFTDTAAAGDDGNPQPTTVDLSGAVPAADQIAVFIVVKIDPASLKDVVKPLKVEFGPKPKDQAPVKPDQAPVKPDKAPDDHPAAKDANRPADYGGKGHDGGKPVPPPAAAAAPPPAPAAAAPPPAPDANARELNADVGKNGLVFASVLGGKYASPVNANLWLTVWNENPVDIVLQFQVGAGPKTT